MLLPYTRHEVVRCLLRIGRGRERGAGSGARLSQFVQLRRLAGYAGGACFPREGGKLSTGVTMRALPGKASVLIADPLTRHGSA